MGTRERERKNYDRGNEIITVGNKPKKKSKGYQRQGNERVELALEYKPKEENFLCYSPLRERAPHHNAESLGPLKKKKKKKCLTFSSIQRHALRIYDRTKRKNISF